MSKSAPAGQVRDATRSAETLLGATTDSDGSRGSLPAPRLSWLCSDALLAVGNFGGAKGGKPGVSVSVDDKRVRTRRSSVPYERPLPEGQVTESAVVILLASGVKDEQVLVSFHWNDQETTLGPASAAAIAVDLPSLVRESLASLTNSERERVLDLVVSTCRGHATLDSHRLSHSLHTLRETLREPSPTVQVLRDEPQGLHVGAIVGLGENAFYLRGWMRDERAPIVRLTAISPEGARTSLLDDLYRIRRPDVDKIYDIPFGREEMLGFIGRFSIDIPNYLQDGWIFEMENAIGVTTETQAPSVIRDPLVATNTITGELAGESRPEPGLLDEIVPAVTTLQEQIAESIRVEAVQQFGSPPAAPTVSIVTPLYQRIDLVEHQLAQLAGDPEIGESDLIYVLDSPELADRLMREAGELRELYRIPFRVVVLSHHGGFAVAENRGASFARGERLLLTHSDVVASSPGWLGRLVSFFDSKPAVGAVGPKLLYDDDSLQHAGVYFRRTSEGSPWQKAHHFKGLHRDLPAANVSCQVPAVADACMLLDLELYRELGGLSCVYVPGGYEDSDLCMRLRGAGREVWYLPEVELYHVEGRSYSPHARGEVSAQYSAHLHTRLWGEQIEQLMAINLDAEPDSRALPE
jgi:GT2 family glycosyltransferase